MNNDNRNEKTFKDILFSLFLQKEIEEEGIIKGKETSKSKRIHLTAEAKKRLYKRLIHIHLLFSRE